MDIFVRNENFQLVGLVDVMESIIWTDRYQGWGDFELYVNFSFDAVNLLRPRYYLNVSGSENTMLIESIEIKTTQDSGNKLLVKGRSLAALLERRVIFQTQTYTDSVLQTAILDILYKNGIDSPGQPFRNFPDLHYITSTDPAVTGVDTLSAEYYGQEVYATIKYLCEQTGLGFKLLLDASNTLEFSLYAGKDRSYTQIENPFVVFSPTFDNLVASDYVYSERDYKNACLISGDITDFPRDTLDWYSDHDPYLPEHAYFNRREMFVDAGDLSSKDPATGIPWANYDDMLHQRGKETVLANPIIQTFDGEANTTFGYKYGTDFFLGDIVQIEDMFGNQERARVTEMVICENASGLTTYPTFQKV